MATFRYRCPKTCLRVQGWFTDEWSQPEKCDLSRGVHLVNPASGKTIDENSK